MSLPDALVDAAILYTPIVLGLLMASLVPTVARDPVSFIWFTIALFGVGFALFLTAKVSLIRCGIRVSSGSTQMSPWNRRAYRAGYVLMIFGFLAAFALVIAAGL